MKLKINGKAINSREAFNRGAWVAITLDEEPIGLEILIKSRESDEGTAMQKAAVRRMKAEYQKTQKITIPDPDVAEQDRVDFIVGLCADWRGDSLKNDDGAVPPFSKQGMAELLHDNRWIIPQLDKACGDDRLFLLGS